MLDRELTRRVARRSMRVTVSLFAAAAILLVPLCQQVFGEPVDKETATKAGKNFLAQRPDAFRVKPGHGVAVKAAYEQRTTTEIRDDQGKVAAYVVELNPEGFVILSADTDHPPILGYSDKGTFPIAESRDNVLLHLVKADMQVRRRYAVSALEGAKKAKVLANAAWQKYSGANQKPVPPVDASASVLKAGPLFESTSTTQSWGPLITFATWNQYAPWNNQCPKDPDNDGTCASDSSGIGHFPVGCVATAASQILYYWRYPSAMTFDLTDNYTSTSTCSNGLTTPMVLPRDSAQWGCATFDDLNAHLANIRYDDDPVEQAYLSFGVGVKLKMQYTTEGSVSSNLGSEQLYQQLGFGTASINNNTNCWSTTSATAITNIKAGWPLLIGINGNVGGHSAVLDGYNSTDCCFHVNCGWGGMGDSWYSLPNIIDSSHGIDFTTVNNIVYNIHPLLLAPNLSVTQTTGGTVTVTPSHAVYTYSQTGTLTATASPGWQFVNWSVTGGSVDSNSSSKTILTVLTVTGTCTVTASFALTPYTVTVTPPTNGTVTISPTRLIYYYSNSATITGSANPGYKFVNWSVTGGTVASKTSSNTTLTVKGNVTLTASYHEIVYSDKLTDVGGTIQLTPSKGPLYYGSVVGITASASAGWQFVNWSVTVTGASLTDSTAATTSLTVLGSFDLTAKFSALTYGVSGVASPTAGGTVSVGSVTGTIGQVISISRTANPGYGFTGWTLNDGGHGAKFNSGSASITLGSSNVTLTAGFVQIHYPVTVHQSSSGAVTLSQSQATYTYSQTGTLTVTPTASYNFVSWSVTGGSVASNTSSQTVLTVTSTCSVTASYHKIVYSDTLADVGSGKILMTPSNGPYYLGTVVALTASASPGWKFVSWSTTGGSVISAGSSKTSLTVLGDFDLTANFAAITYGVSGVAGPAAGGTVSVGSATGTIGQVVSISQTANAGYGFIGWKLNDGGHGARFNSGSATIILGSSNVMVTASYAQIHYPVTVHKSTGGAVTLSPSQATYTYSQSGTLTATPSLGYNFVSWSVTGGSVASGTSSKTALTVTSSCTVTASYNELVYSSTLTNNDGSVILSNYGPYTYGQVITVTALATEPEYAFSGWNVTGPSKLGSSTAATTSLTVHGSFTLTASYTYVGSLTTLCAFTGTSGACPGAFPECSLILSGSNLYGTTSEGGANDWGTIFRIPTTGGTPTILHSFTGSDGGQPQGSLTLSGSTLYGATMYGGTSPGYDGFGTIFSIPTSGGTPTILHSFSDIHDGAYPNGHLTLSGSTLYGMTYVGGNYNGSGFGTIFSIPTSGGTPAILYTFSGATDGGSPLGSLTLSGSTLYGMTSCGGASGSGTVFSIPTSGGTPTILFSFDGTHGISPESSLIISGSSLYGMTVGGGNLSLDNGFGFGTVFSIPTHGGTPKVLCSFDGLHGGWPCGSLTLNGSTLYGMTSVGGNKNLDFGWGGGTVFSIPITGGTPTILFSFDGAHGTVPSGDLTLNGSTLYGVTGQGGNLSLNDGWGFGTVFRLPVTIPLQYTVTVITPSGGTVYMLPEQATYSPNAVVEIAAWDPGYNFVNWSVVGGTVASKTSSQTLLTVTGNVTLSASFHKVFYSDTLTNIDCTISLSNSGPYTYGQVITVTASAQTGYAFEGWSVTGPSLLANSAATSTSLTVYGSFTLTAEFEPVPTVLGAFTGTGGTFPGDYPDGDLTFSGSTLYGTTSQGGSYSKGTIFSISTSGGTPTILYTYSGTTDGAYPAGSLTISGSTLYGATSEGGDNNYGTIFSIPTSGGTPTILFSFDYNVYGAYPRGSLVLSGSTLYGMTTGGGINIFGTIFRIPTSGGTPNILYSFSGYADGGFPYGSLALSGSTLYGMTMDGGISPGFGGDGTIFSIPTSGGSLTILYSFTGSNGANPEGSLTLSGSTLYGMTTYGGSGYTGPQTGIGTIFSIPTSGGTPTLLYSFSGATDGGSPFGNLTLSGSTLYGMTFGGGKNNFGTIFGIPTSGGKPTILFSFDNNTYGAFPSSFLTLSGSTLYGMTTIGGIGYYGTVFSFPVISP